MSTEIHEALLEALHALSFKQRIIYDPRLLDGYDGFEGPLDHRQQLRMRLGRELEERHPTWRFYREVSLVPRYLQPKRKRQKRVVPMIDLVLEIENRERHTLKRRVDRYALLVCVAPPDGDGAEGAIRISRHGRSGLMPAKRADDVGYGFLCDVGNLEHLVDEGGYAGGFAILMSAYDGWREGVDPFFPHEGRTLEGKLPRPKTLARKSSPVIELRGTYPLDWRTWSEVPQTAPAGERTKRGDTVDREDFELKYLVVPVTKAPAEE